MNRSSYLHLFRQAAAEFLGTLLLALVAEVLLFGSSNYAQSYQSLYAPFAMGITLAVLIALFGGISGGNFNPAVTCGLFAVRKLTVQQFAAYLGAQCLGAYAAFKMATLLLGASESFTYQATSFVWWGEGIGAFVLAMGVIATVVGSLKPAASGAVIGGSLVVGSSLSLVSSGGIVNPAIALALGARSLPYLIAPLIGGVAAMILYVWMAKNDTISTTTAE